MSPEVDRTLIWLIQTILVVSVIVVLAAVVGIESVFLDFGDRRLLTRLVSYLLLVIGSVFFLFWTVSRLIEEKMGEPQASTREPSEAGSHVDS